MSDIPKEPLAKAATEVSINSLLQTSDLEQLDDLFFIAQTLVEGLYHGRHATPDRGGSTEFFDYRMYVPGDDPRSVDWKLMGRSDRIYVRRYRHFSDLTIHIVVDGSASMDFSGITEYQKKPVPEISTKGELTKWRYASYLAAAIAFLTVRQADRVALTIAGNFAGDGAESINNSKISTIPVGGTWEHLQRVIYKLEHTQPVGEIDLAQCLNAAHQLVKHRSLVIVISDFIMNVAHAKLLDVMHKLLFDGCDVLALQILTPDELDPGEKISGSYKLIDSETFKSVRTHVSSVRNEYVKLIREHNEKLYRGLTSIGINHRLIVTNMPPMQALHDVLHVRKAVS